MCRGGRKRRVGRENDGQILLKWTTLQGLYASKPACYHSAHVSASSTHRAATIRPGVGAHIIPSAVRTHKNTSGWASSKITGYVLVKLNARRFLGATQQSWREEGVGYTRPYAPSI